LQTGPRSWLKFAFLGVGGEDKGRSAGTLIVRQATTHSSEYIDVWRQMSKDKASPAVGQQL
jgi:hypothetical protein